MVFEKIIDIIGTPEILTIRRDVMDVTDILNTRSIIFNNGGITTVNLSGSRREGFCFIQSDIDLMLTVENLRVIWNRSHSQHYDKDSSIDEVFAFDNSNSPPGYGLLEVIMSLDAKYPLHCVINGKVYVSSSQWTSLGSSFNENIRIHGPCIAMTTPYFAFDEVECIRSDFWPPFASSFEKRCHLWPEPSILHDIVKNGCHLVPIGHKLGIHGKEEWRISFAMAEKRLVYSMNHSQFLLYGLMKLFMKEVINRGVEENDELLCSYHMKTAVFWVLQQSVLPECNSRSFLRCFWICFKLIIKWVYEGVCPNFFIPENNLFLVKIHGSVQNKLFCELNAMYEKGLSCLFECPSVRDHIYKSLTSRAQITNPSKINPLTKELLTNIDTVMLILFNFQSCVKALLNVEKLMNFNLTRVYSLVIQRATAAIFHQMAFCLLSLKLKSNKLVYRLSCSAIRLAVKFGDVSDMLFNAMYHFRKHNTCKTLAIVEKAKVLLKRSDMVYPGHLSEDSSVGTKSWLKMSESDVAIINYGFPIIIFNNTFYIEELVTEQQHSLRMPWGILRIPSLVFLHMLEFLCCRHNGTKKPRAVLDELYELLNSNQGRYMTILSRDISWHILGKCQEMFGNLQLALYAYRKSLDEIGMNRIRTATMERIRIVESQMHIYMRP